MIKPPVVHDLQFGTYVSPRRQRGRHSAWPCMCGVTRSHGLLAGAWVRFGDRSFWCCLQRPRRRPRAGRAQYATKAPSTPMLPVLPVGTPPAHTDRLGGPSTPVRLALVVAALALAIPLVLILIGVSG